MAKRYVDDKELLKEIIISKENNNLTPRALELLMKIAKQANNPMKYKYSMDKEDCISRAYEDIWRYWRSFKPEHPKANVFAYFTRMVKYGYAKGFNELYPEIKQDIKLVPISEEDGIFNL